MNDFTSLKLNENILLALNEKGYENPTPIQLQAIPQIIAGKDFLGIAQTGTGKTGAFALPILHLLSQNNHKASSKQILALILTPTRELATQIADNIKYYGKNLKLSCATIFGGVSEFHQIKALKAGVDILIATPGRLLDLTNQKYIDYSQLKILVLDEADRMLDMGFFDDVKKIINFLPEQKQSLLFSATMPKDIENLANKILKDPFKVEITPQATTVEKIDQKVFITSKSNKIAILNHLLTEHKDGLVLIFSQMKHSANRLSQSLEKLGLKNVVLHGNKSQNAREKSLKDFRTNRVKILIATDIVARGIDIPDISLVINFDLPRDYENYVHRIGRTARAGREGVAISLCDATELKALRSIEKMIGIKIPVQESSHIKELETDLNNQVFGVKIGRSSIEHKAPRENYRQEGGRKFDGDAPRHSQGSRQGSRFEKSAPGKFTKSHNPNFSKEHGNQDSDDKRPMRKKGGFVKNFISNFLTKDDKKPQRNRDDNRDFNGNRSRSTEGRRERSPFGRSYAEGGPRSRNPEGRSSENRGSRARSFGDRDSREGNSREGNYEGGNSIKKNYSERGNSSRSYEGKSYLGRSPQGRSSEGRSSEGRSPQSRNPYGRSSTTRSNSSRGSNFSFRKDK